MAEVVTRIVEGAIGIEDNFSVSPSFWHTFERNVGESHIDFIDAEAADESMITCLYCYQFYFSGLPDHISRMVLPAEASNASSSSSASANSLHAQL